MATTRKSERPSTKSSKFLELYGWDLMLGSIAAFYVFMVPYTKVEESFNVQAMHDILHHHHHLGKYDHFDFPGVVSRSFIGAIVVSFLASPVILVFRLLQFPKIYDLIAVRLVLGCIILSTLRLFRIQVRRKFGYQVEAFFVILTAFLFEKLGPIGSVNLAYAFWLKGSYLAALRCLTFTTIVFRCDTLLLLGPVGLCFLLAKSVSLWEAVKCCNSTALMGIGLSVLIDTIMWQNIVWPELEVFWFNSFLNRSSEWGLMFWKGHHVNITAKGHYLYCYVMTHPIHWYLTSALPRSLLAAYPLCLIGVLIDRRILQFILPVFSFILLYSKLPHKELRFIVGSIPIFNLSAAVAASRIYNNRKKSTWKLLYFALIVSLLGSLGCSVITFMASYENYPGAYALKDLHQIARSGNTTDQWVHIDSFAAINGISRFCENGLPWRYSKEEGIAMEEFQHRNFTYLLNEHPNIDGFKCLFAVNGFSRVSLRVNFPPILLLKEPKVYIHGNMRSQHITSLQWPGCPPDIFDENRSGNMR